MKKGLLLMLLFPTLLFAQDLPLEMKIDQGQLYTGKSPVQGFYQRDVVHTLKFTFSDPNWFDTMNGDGWDENGATGEDVMGTLVYNDTLTLDSVMVGIKGNTSDKKNESEKKSFSISIDELKDQTLLGYDNLNLNCAFQDFSSMREVVYYDVTRSFAPALKGSIIDVYINGTYWGPYNNIQQVEGTYIKEWFLDNEGTRWRADRGSNTGGGGQGGGGGGNNFGAGECSLNYNGSDSTDYTDSYILKKTEEDDPWQALIDACDKLNNTPVDNLYEALQDYLDVDRALWFLIQENVFSDDDGYINKGGMDYYVYWDHPTGRILPLEVDGNSVLGSRHIGWGPFHKEDDDDFPLMNKLFANTEIRQRYLAHFRTVLDRYFTVAEVHAKIDHFAGLLDQRVQDDPKKLYSYAEFLQGVTELKNAVTTKFNSLSTNSELNAQGLSLTDVNLSSSNGSGEAPSSGERAHVTVKVEGDAAKVMLYYGLGFQGSFDRVEMYDDGMHEDGSSGDGVYGGYIPEQPTGSYMRYYIEGIKDDAAQTASYIPEGAEHDVFIYQVQQGAIVNEDIVINEVLASNDKGEQDNYGKAEDWIELYNKGSQDVDLGGYYLSDNGGNIQKWQFPENTIIEANDYLIVWADDDEEETTADTLHSNFKLSASGETVYLSNTQFILIDSVEFGEQDTDISWARSPNGTGNFIYRYPTFLANNDGDNTSIEEATDTWNVSVFPVPTADVLYISVLDTEESTSCQIEVYTLTGQLLTQHTGLNSNAVQPISLEHLPCGMYHLIVKDEYAQSIYHKKISKCVKR